MSTHVRVDTVDAFGRSGLGTCPVCDGVIASADGKVTRVKRPEGSVCLHEACLVLVLGALIGMHDEEARPFGRIH
jgi:hypothetical protein